MEKGGIWAAEVENSFAKEPSERFLTSSLFFGSTKDYVKGLTQAFLESLSSEDFHFT
jgi:hypothetical protein